MRLVRQHQPLDRLAADQCYLDELRHVGERHVPVPDLLGIDDDGHALLALIEAAGVVRADDLAEAARGQLLLQLVADLAAAAGLAGALRVTFGTFVDADEDVSLKTRHLAEA